MAVKPLELEDISQQIVDMGTMIAGAITGLDTKLTGRMDKLDSRMDGLEVRMTSQEVLQRETNTRLSSIEGTLTATEADVKELYKLV